MATGQTHLNVSIFDGANQLTHWMGSPASEGGELMMIDMSPVGGPPQFDYDTDGSDRTPYTFTVETKILGATQAARNEFVARYANGKVFASDNITGLPSGINFVVQSANVSHNDKEEGSKLTIKLHEVGPVPAASGGGG